MRVVEVDDGLHGDLSVAEELGELVEEHRSDPFDPDCSWGTTGQDEVGQVQVEGCRPLLRLRRLRDVLVNRPAAGIVEEGGGGVGVAEQLDGLGLEVPAGDELAFTFGELVMDGVGDLIHRRIKAERGAGWQLEGETQGGGLAVECVDCIAGSWVGQPDSDLRCIGREAGAVGFDIGLDHLGLRDGQNPTR